MADEPEEEPYDGAAVELEEDVYNGEAGHAQKHNAVNKQANWLTQQWAQRGEDDVLTASFAPVTRAPDAGSYGLGDGALGAVTTGVNLLAAGDGALGSATEVVDATAFGHGALKELIGAGPNHGIASTGIGFEAFREATEGHHNTGLGHRAGYKIVNGTANTVGGVYAGAGCDEDETNQTPALTNVTAFGYYAARQTRKDGTTAFGSQAGWRNRTGDRLTALGMNSVSSNLAGQSLTGVGYWSLLQATADDNTALGSLSGSNLTTGARNTHIGKSAGEQALDFSLATLGSVSDTVLLGAYAQVTASQAGVIGSRGKATHFNSLALGYATVTTAADQVNVGGRDVEITDTAKGVVIKSPDGTRYRIKIANGGALSTVAA